MPTKSKLLLLIELTKPRILLLVLLTGLAAVVIERHMLENGWRILVLLVGLALTGGSANAFNMYFERGTDAVMSRTKRRPLPTGKVSPGEALIVAIAAGIGGVAILVLVFNMLSGLLALGTIAYYAFFYTLVLKPNTYHSIVIGGAAGAMAPVISWAAARNSIDLAPMLLFLIVLLWSPPHFWALSLLLQADYRTSRLPMLPLVRGEAVTKRQIFVYSVMLVVSSLFLLLIGAGWLYLATAFISGVVLLVKAVRLARSQIPSRAATDYFRYSIVYLFFIFLFLIVDNLSQFGF